VEVAYFVGSTIIPSHTFDLAGTMDVQSILRLGGTVTIPSKINTGNVSMTQQ